MADDRASTTLSAAAQRVLDYLSDINNLPVYFDRMTSATPGDGETVQTTATMPDGTETAGEAWFHVDSAAKALSWGSEGPNDYHGQLEVADDGDTSTLSTERTEIDRIQQGLEQTLTNISRLTHSG
jgi:uncharacterized membrane protein